MCRENLGKELLKIWAVISDKKGVHDGATQPPQTPTLLFNKNAVFPIISKNNNRLSCKK